MDDLVTVSASQKGRRALAAIEQASIAESSRRKYLAALQRYLETGNDPYDAIALSAYAGTVSDSERGRLSAAVGHYAGSLIDDAKAQARPDNAAETQATIWRAEALRKAVTTRKSSGQKAHTWLTAREVKTMLSFCSRDQEGLRDKLALGLMVAAGLRRAEAVALTFDDAVLQPVAERIRTVLSVRGKGDKNRVVPISDPLAATIDAWGNVVGYSGCLLRSQDQRGEWRASLSDVALFHIVQKYGAEIGKPKLAPHDLRRTYAQLGFEAGVPITQIGLLLGHASIETTRRYLNMDLDLAMTVSDFIPF